MKILAVCDDFLPAVHAGSEVSLFLLLRWLARHGHDVQVIADGPPMQANIDGVKITRGVRPDYASYDVIFTQQGITRRVINEIKPHGKPLVALAHNLYQITAYRVQPGEVQLLIYNSYWLAKKLRHLAPSMVVHPPVEMEDYDTSGDDQDRNSIVQVNLTKLKGGPLFWWLARNMPERHFAAVYGTYGEQSIPSAIPINAELLPSTPNQREFYRRALLLLMPSATETYGRVALEAACSGIPSILSPTEGLLEAMGQHNALWADPNKPEDWINSINKLMDNPELYIDYAQRAQRRACEVTAWLQPEMYALEAALYSLASPARARVWAVGSEPHYVDHVAAQMHAVPPEHRGSLVLAPIINSDSWPAAERAMRLGLSVVIPPTIRGKADKENLLECMGHPDAAGSVCLVVSERDRIYAESLFPGRVIRGEHGAGQSYDFQNSSLPGHPASHKTCLAATAPNAIVAAKIQQANPSLTVAPIGSPRLEAMRASLVDELAGTGADERPNVAFSFRYPGLDEISPEFGSAWVYYKDTLAGLKATYNVALHCHPRSAAAYAGELKLLGIPVIAEFYDALMWADLFVVDNSSAALDWLYVRRGGLVLVDSPKYRRWVNHGLRFWEVETWGGVATCRAPEQLADTIAAALAGNPDTRPANGWYDQADPKRLGEWLQRFLRPAGEQTKVKFLSTCVGDYGRFKTGNTAYIPTPYATALIQRNLAVVVEERESQSRVIDIGRFEADLARVTAYAGVHSWAMVRMREIVGGVDERHSESPSN